MDRTARAQRALLHPLWLCSLATLAVNDHLLKGAGVLPGAVTGKLSDVAGLVMAPALLAAALGLRTRSALAAAHVAVGAVFALLEVSPGAAAVAERLSTLTPWPWRLTLDPTDLAALPALLISWWVLVPAMRAPVPARPRVQRALVAAGGLACAATSAPPEDCRGGFCGGGGAFEWASLTLGNATGETRLVRVRPLRDTAVADCARVLAAPERTLTREAFGPAEAWLLEPGRALPLSAAECGLYLVDADGLAPHLLAWSTGDFPTTTLGTEIGPVDPAMVVMRGMGRLELAPHPAVYPAPVPEEGTPVGACAVPPETAGLAWVDAPLEGGTVTAIETAPDGCHRVALEGAKPFYLCAPPESLSFAVGDHIVATETTVPSWRRQETAGAGATALVIEGEGGTMALVRGGVAARWEEITPGSPSRFDLEVEALPECPGAPGACGLLRFPLDVTLVDADGRRSPLQAGSARPVWGGAGTLFMVRAEWLPVRDALCHPEAESERWFESVLVFPAVPNP